MALAWRAGKKGERKKKRARRIFPGAEKDPHGSRARSFREIPAGTRLARKYKDFWNERGRPPELFELGKKRARRNISARRSSDKKKKACKKIIECVLIIFVSRAKASWGSVW
jgi:hypothetical protein